MRDSVTGREGPFDARPRLCDCARLRAERDYYRRRWLVHGIRYPHYLGYWRDKYVAAVMEVLARARAEDA